MALGDVQKHCFQPFSLTKIVSIVSLIYKQAFRQFHCAFLCCSAPTITITQKKYTGTPGDCDLEYNFVLQIEAALDTLSSWTTGLYGNKMYLVVTFLFYSYAKSFSIFWPKSYSLLGHSQVIHGLWGRKKQAFLCLVQMYILTVVIRKHK